VAEYTGGYGNLIEIEHGGGVATRYGHLSGYAVAPGERVEAGEVVGYAGSTGRSTGSHLHYETRINGEPVNPLRFLEAGTRVAGLLAETR
jgi:murein DD-endopeptidase MepM/ murein hydrolase activator NlpD